MKVCTKCSTKKLETEFYERRPGVRHTQCKSCIREKKQQRDRAARTAGLCYWCKRPSKTGTCKKCKAKNLARYHSKKVVYLEVSKERRQRLKLEAMQAYGGPTCKCCGVAEIEFLAIDHIKNDGAAHRRALMKQKGWKGPATQMAGSHFYLWLKQQGYPPGFQVLCMNCNFAKGRFGYCPHDGKLRLVKG